MGDSTTLFMLQSTMNVGASRPPPRIAAAPYLVADIAGFMVSESAAHVAAPVLPCGRQAFRGVVGFSSEDGTEIKTIDKQS
jgi:hypothetical protein